MNYFTLITIKPIENKEDLPLVKARKFPTFRWSKKKKCPAQIFLSGSNTQTGEAEQTHWGEVFTAKKDTSAA
jgi:hypothetical protein